MIYVKLFLEFFKIGLFSFGGGAAMLPLIKDTVTSNDWLTLEQFNNFIGVCESTPGPIAVNMATYIGSIQAGFLGSVVATLGVVLPSFIIIILIAAILKNFIKNKYFQGFLDGIKPVIIALILGTGITLLLNNIGLKNLNFDFNIYSLICFIIVTVFYYAILLIGKKKIPTIALIIFSAILGIIVCL